MGPVTRRPTRDGSATLYSARYGQPYASEHGALSGAKRVFLEGSRVGQRLARGETVRVLEVGFGTGLNFFVTAAACLEGSARLEYTAREHTLKHVRGRLPRRLQPRGQPRAVDRRLPEGARRGP